MLYVFLVDTGTIMTFDMNLALESVAKLKTVISRACKIPEDKQVLLISGGKNLHPESKVCNYSAGTDTNPIFLFSKCAIESVSPPLPNVEYGSDLEMKDQVDGCSSLQATYNAVVARTQLAQQFNELAKEQRRVCERLVHDQHLQQQGWAAVVANLEDITSAFKEQASICCANFKRYLEAQNYHMDLLKSFSEDLGQLSKIPMLPALLAEAKLHNSSELVVSSESETALTLLQWISFKDCQSSLEQVAERCIRGLEQFDAKTLKDLEEAIKGVLENVDNPGMKEVRGLEERLYGLEQLMHEAKQFESEQADLAQAFLHNQTRAGNLRDQSILPDLCTSHQRQLQLMLRNHQALRDIRRRCTKAKEELSANLHSRLRWIMFVEKIIWDTENRIVIYDQHLKRLIHHLKVVQQIHLAPKIYLSAVAEVVRRKTFSKTFLQWACTFSKQSLDLHRKEVATRKSFNIQMGNHFLKSLFPGMGDFPPPFATQSPEHFDTHLPNITTEDLENLKRVLPELADFLMVPSLESMPWASFILSESGVSNDIPALHPVSPHSYKSENFPLQRIEIRDSVEVVNHDLVAQKNINSSLCSPTEELFLTAGDCDKSTKQCLKSQISKINNESEGVCVKLHLAESNFDKNELSPIEAENSKAESDTEEFERVDVKVSEHLEIKAHCEMHIKDGTDSTTSVKYKEGYKSDVGKFSFTQANFDIHMPEDHIKSPESLLASSQDFLTADFFIDESMPSSYTESNGTSGLLRGSQMIKSHHLVVAELQRQLEENTLSNLKISRSDVVKLQTTMSALQMLTQEMQDYMKIDLEQLRCQVLQERELITNEICAISSNVEGVLEKVQQKIELEKLTETKKFETELSSYKEALQNCECKLKNEEIASAMKLSEAYQEISVYREQLDKHSEIINSLQNETEAKIEEVKQEATEEKEEIIRKLILEHELEMESLREEFKKAETQKEEEIKDLKDMALEKQSSIDLLNSEKTSLENCLLTKFQKEKDTLIRSLEQSYKEKENIAVQLAIQSQVTSHQEELRRLVLNQEETINEVKEKIYLEQLSIWKDKMQNLQLDLEKKHQTEITAKENEFKALQELNKNELESLRSRFKMAYSTATIERSPSDCSLETIHLEKDVIDLTSHDKIIAQLHRSFNEQRNQDVSEALEALLQQEEVKIAEIVETERRLHEADLQAAIAKLKKEHQDQIMALKANMQAEKQVTFNEAVCKITREKNNIIEDLQRQIAEYKRLQETDQGIMENLLKEKSDALLTAGDSLKDVPNEASQQLADINMKLMCEKEAKIQELENKLSELSSTSAKASPVSDKVSVLSCNVGDIVLLCYDEKYENYMVLVLGPILHFLDTECLETLGLKSVPGEPRRTWAFAEVSDKDFCQARKPHNRFKMPVGCRFFRVKAKPWDKEISAKRQLRHSGSMSSSSEPSEIVTQSIASSTVASETSLAMSESCL